MDMHALTEADQVLLVTQLDLPCLRNVVRLMMSFKESDKFDDKVKIVVNRVGYDTGQISLKKAQETIGRDIFWQIPNDYRVMVEVRNNGVPLVQQAPKAAITQSINQLAVAPQRQNRRRLRRILDKENRLAKPLARPRIKLNKRAGAMATARSGHASTTC